MIIQNNDGSLVCPDTGRRWCVQESSFRAGLWVVGLLFPPASIEQESVILNVLAKSESEDECAAFLASLALRLGAVRWDGRAFVRVERDVNG